MNLTKCSLFFFMCFFSLSTHADVKVAFEIGSHGGGDEFTSVSTTSGTQNVAAGGGISYAVGALMDLSDDLSMMVTFGQKEDSVEASNGNISFSRNTIDLLVHKQFSDLISFGAGATYHMGVELRADGAGSSYVVDEDFENAFGLLADMKFDVGDPGDFFLAIRLTFIDYTSKTAANGKSSYDGSGIGFIWGGVF